MKKVFIHNEIDFVKIHNEYKIHLKDIIHKDYINIDEMKLQVTIVNQRVTLFDIKFNYLINFLMIFLYF